MAAKVFGVLYERDIYRNGSGFCCRGAVAAVCSVSRAAELAFAASGIARKSAAATGMIYIMIMGRADFHIFPQSRPRIA